MQHDWGWRAASWQSGGSVLGCYSKLFPDMSAKSQEEQRQLMETTLRSHGRNRALGGREALDRVGDAMEYDVDSPSLTQETR